MIHPGPYPAVSLKAHAPSRTPLPAQKAANLLCALETITLLVSASAVGPGE